MTKDADFNKFAKDAAAWLRTAGYTDAYRCMKNDDFADILEGADCDADLAWNILLHNVRENYK